MRNRWTRNRTTFWHLLVEVIFIAAATIAEFATIILLPLFFSGKASSTGTKLIFFAGFIVTTGVRFDLAALIASPATVLHVPIFLLALLVVRGLPAILYRSSVGTRRTVVAGLLQTTSLSFYERGINLRHGYLTEYYMEVGVDVRLILCEDGMIQWEHAVLKVCSLDTAV